MVHRIVTNVFSFHYYLEVCEFITRVNIIASLLKGNQIKALYLGYEKIDRFLLKFTMKKILSKEWFELENYINCLRILIFSIEFLRRLICSII